MRFASVASPSNVRDRVRSATAVAPGSFRAATSTWFAKFTAQFFPP
jgi:hypothetical protein